MIARPRVLVAVVLVTISFHSACAAAPPAASCQAEVTAQWPAAAQPRAHMVVNRESHGIATAKNRRSTASGCFQLLRVHSARFARLGYSWIRDRFNARVNVAVALDLWREQGWRPWRLTA